MEKAIALVVSSDHRLIELVQKTLSEAAPSCTLEACESVETVVARLERGGIDVVLVHLRETSDEMRIVDPLQHVLRSRYRIPLLVLTEDNDRERRRRLLGMGILECMERPLDLSRLACLLSLLTASRRVGPSASVPPGLPDELQVTGGTDSFLLASDATRALVQQFVAVAPLDTTLILTGETGTGKSLAARVIHEFSPRQQQPFVAVGCGGLSPTLLESELFGHTRGAFTGADRDHDGKFTLAGGGTILLDEVDCVPPEAQAKLLGVLEQRVYEPLGSNRLLPLRARVIAATNQPLEGLVAAGRFRSDLYYRLNVVEFRLPPLRQTPEAIRPLVRRFLSVSCAPLSRPRCSITEAAMSALEAYAWPGNVRELRNTVVRAVALCRGPAIDLVDLPEAIQRAHPQRELPAERFLWPSENRLVAARKHGELLKIMECLRRHHNNRTKAAQELGISRRGLYKKLHEHGLIAPSVSLAADAAFRG